MLGFYWEWATKNFIYITGLLSGIFILINWLYGKKEGKKRVGFKKQATNEKKINRSLHRIREGLAVSEFLKYKGLEGKKSFPDPPDCIVSGVWIEHSTIYRHWSERIETNAYRYECPPSPQVQEEIIQQIKTQINKKDCNSNYDKFTKKYGRGYLVLDIFDTCFHWQRDLAVISDLKNYSDLKVKNFNEVCLYNYPVAAIKECSDPLKWSFKVLSGYDHFFLLWQNDA